MNKRIIKTKNDFYVKKDEFKSIRESELKVYLNNGKVYYEYEGVELLRRKYESLLQKYKEIKWRKKIK